MCVVTPLFLPVSHLCEAAAASRSPHIKRTINTPNNRDDEIRK